VSSLAVLGGGPKGAAVAAKAAALLAEGYQPPAVTIFEPDKFGAAWTGTSGYTDGLQPLCTLAERDFGFPYDRMTFGDAVAADMLSRFSWHRFSVEEGIDDTLYENWVVQGRKPPAVSGGESCWHSKLNEIGAALWSARMKSTKCNLRLLDGETGFM
jgi:mycobactin lysine-N-oxygenase